MGISILIEWTMSVSNMFLTFKIVQKRMMETRENIYNVNRAKIKPGALRLSYAVCFRTWPNSTSAVSMPDF